MESKTELAIKGRPSLWFDTLEEAMAVGRELHLAGAVVHIEVFPEEVPGPMTGYRFDGELDAWVSTHLPFSSEAG